MIHRRTNGTSLPVVFIALLAAGQARAEEPVRYQATVALDWNAATHGPDHPETAHWSRLVAVAHGRRYSLFADGDTASSGLALIATNGRPSILEAELTEARRRNRVGAQVVVEGPSVGAGTVQFEIGATEDFPLLSFATMLAPSPDWFSGVAAIPLHDGEEWREEIELPLWVWDAGADSGAAFGAPNADTQPRESIRLSTHGAFLGANGLRSVGSVTVMRLRD